MGPREGWHTRLSEPGQRQRDVKTPLHLPTQNPWDQGCVSSEGHPPGTVAAPSLHSQPHPEAAPSGWGAHQLSQVV